MCLGRSRLTSRAACTRNGRGAGVGGARVLLGVFSGRARVRPARRPLRGTRHDLRRGARGRRVIDPASGLDAVRDVGISDGRIAAIATRRLAGRDVIDVSGLVVAPGFVDCTRTGRTSRAAGCRRATASRPRSTWRPACGRSRRGTRRRRGRSPIHYGAAAGHIPARRKLKHEVDTGHPPTSSREMQERFVRERAWAYAAATPGGDRPPRRAPRGRAPRGRARDRPRHPVHAGRRAGRGPARVRARRPDARADLRPHAVDQHVAARAAASRPCRRCSPTPPPPARRCTSCTSPARGLRQTPVIPRPHRRRAAARRRRQHRGIPLHGRIDESSPPRSSTPVGRSGSASRTATSSGRRPGERLTRVSFERYRKTPGNVIVHMIPEDVVTPRRSRARSS
jgi:hypothetical protein